MMEQPVPEPTTRGPPPKPGLPPRVPYGEAKRNPVTSAPVDKTLQYRIRGSYRNVETIFVSEELNRLGYTETKSNNDWDIMWTIRMFKEEYAILAPFQKVNFIPGLQHICSKNLLHQNICAARNRWMNLTEDHEDQDIQELAKCNFWPVGFNLEIEEQFNTLAQIYSSNISDNLLYIIKKPFTSCGRGVEIIHSLEQLLEVRIIKKSKFATKNKLLSFLSTK